MQAAVPEALLGFGPMVTKVPASGVIDRRWTVWGGAFGAQGRFNGDAVVGSNTLAVGNGGFAAGIDYRVSRDTAIGFALAGGADERTPRRSRLRPQRHGAGRRIWLDQARQCLSVGQPLAFGRHDLTIDRTVAAGGYFRSADGRGSTPRHIGGRLEGGYRHAVTPDIGITPYGALQLQSFGVGCVQRARSYRASGVRAQLRRQNYDRCPSRTWARVSTAATP